MTTSAEPDSVADEAPGAALADVFAFVTAVPRVPGGQFLGRMPVDGIDRICIDFGAPLFAIAALAGDVLAQPAPVVALGGKTQHWTIDGGRWLSLFARVFQPACRMSFVVCAPGRNDGSSHWREILFQPAQRIVPRHWRDYLANAKKPPDALLINGLFVFEDILDALASPQVFAVAQHAAVLLSLSSQAEAVVVQALARALSYEAGEVATFGSAAGPPFDMREGTYWVRVRSAGGTIATLDSDARESFASCFKTFWRAFDANSTNEHHAAVARTYGTIANLSVDGEALERSVLFGPDSGIDSATGRVFERSPEGPPSWVDAHVTAEVMSLCPARELPPPNRFEVMSWVGRALMKGMLHASLEAGDANVEEAPTAAASPSRAPVTKPASSAFRRHPRPSLAAGTSHVLAGSASLGGPGRDPATVFDDARASAIAWLASRGFRLSTNADSALLETPAGELTVETDGSSLWSMRLDDRAQIAQGATWRTELTLLGGDSPSIAVRSDQIRQRDDAPPPESASPAVVSDIAARIGLHERGAPLLCQAWIPTGEEDIGRLLELLDDRLRTHPVVAIFARDDRRSDGSFDALGLRLTGVAHVVVVDRTAADAMTRRFGRSRSLHDGAIRVYPPGFGAQSDPFNSPMWPNVEVPIPGLVADDIAFEASAIVLDDGDVEARVPSFASTRQRIVELRLQSARRQTLELASSAEEERDRQQSVRNELEAALHAWKTQTHDLREAVAQLRLERETLTRERNEARDEVRRLEYRLATAWRAPADVVATQPKVIAENRYPDSWDNLENWIESHGSNRLVLLPQAAKSARESSFADIPFAYQVFEFLVDHYVPLRSRSEDDEDVRKRYEQARAALGIEVSPVGKAVEDRRYRAQYLRPYEGRTIVLDQHAKWGAARDRGGIFRLYFWYDADRAQVVVGHLPTHLVNGFTHTA